MRHRAHLLVSLLVAAWCCQAGAQARIYSCVDAHGRRLTADRPIMECLDREQQEYGANGMARGKLPRSMTAEERAVEEEKTRQENLARQRQAELKRRDRVLLNRYPTPERHERERASSLSGLDEAIAAGERRVADLTRQRDELQKESQAARKDVIRSNRVRRALGENADNLAAQQRLLAAQREERARIAVRFDEERARLQVLWAQSRLPAQASAGAVPVAARPPRPAASGVR